MKILEGYQKGEWYVLTVSVLWFKRTIMSNNRDNCMLYMESRIKDNEFVSSKIISRILKYVHNRPKKIKKANSKWNTKAVMWETKKLFHYHYSAHKNGKVQTKNRLFKI